MDGNSQGHNVLSKVGVLIHYTPFLDFAENLFRLIIGKAKSLAVCDN
jgi:hypothetical protein